MATQVLCQPHWVNSALNATCPKFAGGLEEPEYIEVASSSWGIGDLLYIDTDGKVAICTDSTGQLDSAIAGQALKAATGTTGASVFFRVIRPDDVFVMNVYHSSAGSAVTNQNQIGDIFGIIKVSSKWHVDIENTTTEDGSTALAKVQVVGFPDRNPATGDDNVIGDTYGCVEVKFLPFTIASDGSPFTRNLQLA